MDTLPACRENSDTVPPLPGKGIAELREEMHNLKEEVENLREEIARPNEQLWDVKDVAYYLNISKRSVETLIAEGEITPLRVRSCRRFDAETIKTWVRKQMRF